MTGYQSKKAAAQDKLNEDDDTQVYKNHGDALTIAYQSGYYAGKKAAQQEQEPTFWLNEQGQLSATRGFAERNSIGQKIIPLYTTPPAQPAQRTEQNFCPRCGKRTADLTVIHTCTPPQEST